MGYRQFERIPRIKQLLVGKALRLRRPDFESERAMVSIIGDHISDQIRAEGLFERDALEILRDRFLDLETCREKVALDVGANIGNHTLFFSDLFAQVLAFEPNPLARSLLEINLKLNHAENVEVRPVGLSDAPGKITLSFDITNLGATRANDPSAGSLAADAELVMGDEAISRDVKVGFIKIDVEGAEDAVLRGLENTIRRNEPVLMIEQLVSNIDPATGLTSAFAFLRDLGFSAWDHHTARLPGPLGKLTSFVAGRSKYAIRRIERLQMRDYYALIFTPPSHVFPN